METRKRLADMAWPEAAAAAQAGRTVLIPVGSFEQHGTHLPLCSDTVQAEEMALDAVALLDQWGIKAAVGPAIPFGVNPGAMAFPGSVTLKPDTLKQLLAEVCLSLKAHGFDQAALIMGHDENLPAMLMAAQELTHEHGVRTLALNWLPYLKLFEQDQLSAAGARTADGHGGAGETSRMLARFPELVRLEQAQAYTVPLAPAGEALAYSGPPLLGGGVYNPAKDLTGFAPPAHPGIVGDPRLADAANGEQAYHICAEWIAQVIRREFYPGLPA